MNYLAHAVLAGPDPLLRLGGLMGDFVKGPLPPGTAGIAGAAPLPERLVLGLRLHRAIDAYAETHPAFRASRARVSAERRRVAGIMVDLFYDHFLARDWAAWPAAPGFAAFAANVDVTPAGSGLAAYCAATYALFDAHAALLPPRLAEVAPLMAAHDWLGSYAEAATIALALDRMAARRFSRPTPLAGGGAELLMDYDGFAADFRAFFADALEFARQWREREGLAD